MNNFDIVSLPINVNPIIRSYRVHSYLINIMENIYPDFENMLFLITYAYTTGRKIFEWNTWIFIWIIIF